MKEKQNWKYFIALIIAVLLVVVCVVVTLKIKENRHNGESSEEQIQNAIATSDTGTLSNEGYKIEQVVVLSRHNIRSPLSGKDSGLGKMTPHEWFEWSSNPSELSLRGGVLETEMGQYFRKWLEEEGLFPDNYHPEDGEVRIYANSKQRTIATAEYFVSGLLPTANIPLETHMEFDKMDPVFTPQITFLTPEYSEDAKAQIMELYADDINGLEDNYKLISDVIDLKESESYKSGEQKDFRTDDSELILEEGEEPKVTGSLKTACSVADALVLQYYENPDAKAASFGHDLTMEQWKDISEVKDTYEDVLFAAPLVAVNVAHPLLCEIESEMLDNNRKFSFLCGHDSNLASVLAALGAKDYELPGAIEAKTPIGCKLVICSFTGSDGKKYCSVNLVYQTTEQLRNMDLLDLNNPPAMVPIYFSSIEPNVDGLYLEQDFMDLLRRSIEEYDQMVDDYSMQKAA